MEPNWNDTQPIYRQLRDRIVTMILEGVVNDGDALPSVRQVAGEYQLNPLTVLKGYQALVDEELVLIAQAKSPYGATVTADDLPLLPFVTYDESEYVFGKWMRTCLGVQTAVRSVAHFEELEEVMELVRRIQDRKSVV